ncbi:LysR substrate-binding domain-containing protein [Clostridium estertheticum]|uniref:LysR substrate-binding domain-containing protein n=1 Tax=Clostridium estertheticum TaxID=238834 RepID=UPI001CF1DB57|nr:LysR substrate-binding domain-containing protein [Clostridium estertheticum]MCB2354562.1 substrate-binding domain-containing protein [Clostridium estertheticum]MCB2358489.1 substrate-binding domain-containing protein [Clostridium estertheticum]WAG40812.1 substrate-binding domain-containing protein [Clostridium estertheticum]
MPDSLLIYLLQPVIQVFRQDAPNVQLIINAMNCIDIRENLIDGSADIGIHCNVGGYPDTIALKELGPYTSIY